MEKGKVWRGQLCGLATRSFSIFSFLTFLFLLLSGCGAPGDPVPPTPPVPAAVKDLSARQAGDGVELSFTLPANTVSGQKLTSPPAVEILRGAAGPSGATDTKTFRMVYTIPGVMVENYRANDKITFNDPIAPAETKAHPGRLVAYAVRTRASEKRASADSNVIVLKMYPVPAPVASMEARVTESGVELSWPVPTMTGAGEPVSAITGYRVYRAEISRNTADKPETNAPQTKPQPRLALLGAADSNSYKDISAVFGTTYLYVVRSVTQMDGSELESSDSQPLSVTPRDTFPPAVPRGLVAAVLPGATPGSLLVDLSWAINVETDLAGYRVYRSEQEGTGGSVLNAHLLPTPAVRDTSVEPGHRYWYTVTAVDRAGNESAASTPVEVEVTQPSP